MFLEHRQARVTLVGQQLVLRGLQLVLLFLQFARQGIQGITRAGRADLLAVDEVFVHQRIEECLCVGRFGTGNFQDDDGCPGCGADTEFHGNTFQFRRESCQPVGGARLQVLALEQFDLGAKKELQFLAVRNAFRQINLAAHPKAGLGDIRLRPAQHVETHEAKGGPGRQGRQPPVPPQVTHKTRGSAPPSRAGLRIAINGVVGILPR